MDHIDFELTEYRFRMKQETLIISIWKADPVGGEYVDWPPLPEHACIRHWHALQDWITSQSRLRDRCPNLTDFAKRLPGSWIPPDRVMDVLRELEDILTAHVEHPAEVSAIGESVNASLDMLRSACRFASNVDVAGVYVG